ncbi:MAG: hypothetical protein ACREQ1_12445 [Woeseiaceae bacterium]
MKTSDAGGSADKIENRSQFALPLVIAVTGHRDLVADEIPAIRRLVKDLFIDLNRRHSDRTLRVMSALAEGADRLVAEEALALGLELVVPLPMARRHYIQDFETEGSLAEFDSLASKAAELYELPLADGVAAEDLAHSATARSRQYAQLGIFLCAHCHILLALWDGKPSSQLGGTAQIVRFHHDDIMPGYATKTFASQQTLVDDESDLVYHIVCSRMRPGGAPNDDVRTLDWWWFTKDRDNPRSKVLPEQHRMISRRSSEFSRDSVRFAERIEAEKYPLLEEGEKDYLPAGIDNIDKLFCMADWLAIHFQKKTLFSLRATHFLAFPMGLMFLLYSELKSLQYFMFAFLLFFVVAAAVQYVATREGWHRKYLDYRALAEGLRVQFYWAAAGVNHDNISKFAHDNFLQTQDPELGWIRNVMRVAGTRCDAAPATGPEGLEFARREWIGDQDSGQLGYFRKKALERVGKSRMTERLAMISMLASITVISIMVVAGPTMTEGVRDVLMITMGGTLLLFGIRQGFAHSTAEKELIKQYEFMLRIFHNARRRLENAEDAAEQRQILRALGGSALDEHAQWILMHRDRSLDQGEIWRMGS